MTSRASTGKQFPLGRKLLQGDLHTFFLSLNFAANKMRKAMGKVYTFCVHDESVNTYGFRMLTSGANLEEFKKNPVVLYNHNDWETPIGRGENVRVEDGRILVDVVFDEEDEKGRTIAGKVERGFLRMASVGSWPPEEVSDDPALKLPGQTGPTATRWTMR